MQPGEHVEVEAPLGAELAVGLAGEEGEPVLRQVHERQGEAALAHGLRDGVGREPSAVTREQEADTTQICDAERGLAVARSKHLELDRSPYECNGHPRQVRKGALAEVGWRFATAHGGPG